MNLQATSKDKQTLDRPRILHVDDNRDFLELFKLRFGDLFDIVSLEDSTNALEKIENDRFDAVITDYDMPGMNGLELLSKIKKRWDFLPVIFYTGQGNEQVARDAFINGASDYFSKEVRRLAHQEKFVNAVTNAIEKRRAKAKYRETSDLLEAVFNAIPDVIGIQDTDRTIIRYNHAGYQLVKKTAAQAHGKKCYELINREKPCISCATEKTCKTGKPSTILKYMKKEDKWLEVRTYPIFDEEGKVVKVVEHIRDITEFKKTREREQLFRFVFDKISIPTVIADKYFKPIAINRAFQAEFDLSEKEVLSEEFRGRLMKSLPERARDCITHGEKLDHENEVMRICLDLNNAGSYYFVIIKELSKNGEKMIMLSKKKPSEIEMLMHAKTQ